MLSGQSEEALGSAFLEKAHRAQTYLSPLPVEVAGCEQLRCRILQQTGLYRLTFAWSLTLLPFVFFEDEIMYMI